MWRDVMEKLTLFDEATNGPIEVGNLNDEKVETIYDFAHHCFDDMLAITVSDNDSLKCKFNNSLVHIKPDLWLHFHYDS